MNTGGFICYTSYNKYYLLVRSMNTFIIPLLYNAIKIYNSDQRRMYITIFAVDYNHFSSRNISTKHYGFK